MYLSPVISRNGEYTLRAVLLASGLLAVLIAGLILFAPELIYTGNGISLSGNATLANELKASTGILLVAGLAMLVGVFQPHRAAFSLAIAVVVYLSYGFSRVVSMVIDGLPNDSMVSATALELAIGLTCLAVLVQRRTNNK